MSNAEDQEREKLEKLFKLRPSKGFRFSDEQIDWVNEERKVLFAQIEAKPEKGLFRLVARQEALQLLCELHNLEMKKD